MSEHSHSHHYHHPQHQQQQQQLHHHQSQQQQHHHHHHLALQHNQQKLHHKELLQQEQQHHLHQQQQQQQQQQSQHNWYSHVASYPPHATAFSPPPPPLPPSPCKGNNMNMSAYGGDSAVSSIASNPHAYYSSGGGGGSNMGVNVNAGGSSSSTTIPYNNLESNAVNSVAYAHNQLLQYQQQQHHHHQQQQHQQQQQQQQQLHQHHHHNHHTQRAAYMHHHQHPHHQHPSLMHGHSTGYPYIKTEPIELNDERRQHYMPPNPMAPPPVPPPSSRLNSSNSARNNPNDLIIKSEPSEDHAFRSTNYIDDNMPFADFSKYPEFSQDLLSPKLESHQKLPVGFPRRKVQSERSENLPICQRCKEVFFKKQTYLQHVAESTCSIQEYDLKCGICPMSFMSAEERHAHKLLHRASKFFCLKYCGKHFDTIGECEAHEYMQHEHTTFVCNMCAGAFATRDQLYAHLPQHEYQPRFDCPICRVWYPTPLQLHEHRLAEPYYCGKYYTGDMQQAQQQQQQVNYKLQDCRMGAIEMPSPHHKASTSANANANTNANTALPATAALNSLLQQRQANAEGAALYASSLKSDVKLERSFSNSTTSGESSFSLHDGNNFNNAYGNDSLGAGGVPQSTSANSSTLDDSDDALCCVPLCGVRKSTSPTLQFFTFPKDEKYLQQWLHNLKMFHIPAATYATYRICSMHFPKRCINRYSLCYWAVPTFNLGHDDVANLYQNRELTNTFTTGEVARCSMPNCSSQRGESNLKFYNFPKDIKSLIKWCQNARLPVQAKEPRHFCSRHFEERCIGKFRLKPWAVPTLHLGTQYGKIHDNPKNLYVEEKRCCLPFCRRSRSSDFNMSLYRFPRDEVLLRRWCYNLRLDPAVYRGKNHKICSAHFIKEALGLRKLSPGAVPTLHLGHNDTFNIYENELWPPPPVVQSNHHHQQQVPPKLYHRQSAPSTTSSSASSISHYMESDLGAYHSMSSTSLNVSDCMDVCCVPGCENKRHNNEEITFHTIPRRPEQMRKWCHNLKIPEEKMHKGMRICSVHFEPYCIGGCMRPFAVPTLHLGHDDDDIHRNPDVIKKLNIRETCCVQVCKRNRDRDHANLHRFPSNVALLTKWCGNLHKPVPDGTKLFNDAICEVHFEERCLRNKRLEKWAVPTLQLGHDDIPYKLPTPEEIAEFYARPSAPNNGEEEGECCVDTCKRNPSVDDIKLYRPPEDAEVLAKWAHNLQLDVETLPNSRICNLHFEPYCIGKRMRAWAIPTLNLSSTVETPYENPPEHTMLYVRKERRNAAGSTRPQAVKPTWVPRCCLPHCRKVRAIHNVQLYRFPKINRSTLAKWAHNLQVPMVGSAQRRICSMHFEPHVLSKKCPVPLAVPTLELNTPSGYKIYQNPAKLKANKLCLQRVCIVESCRRQRSLGVQLFRFPHSPTQFRKWLHNLKQRHKTNLRSQLRICSLHFETHSFNGRRLSAGAIPTLELGHDDDDIYPNEAQSFVEENCVVEGCQSNKDQPDVRLFRFPTDDEDLLWKWCNNLKMNPIDCLGMRICNKHFEGDCVGPKHLYKWAIPTLALGHDDDQIELVTNPKPEDRYIDPVFKCCVPTCGKSRRFDEAQMNSFPKDPEFFHRWRHNLQLEHLNFKERDRYKICNAHFRDICIGKTRLNVGAIPTLELGHNNTDDLYQVNPEELKSSLFGRPKRLVGGGAKSEIKQEPTSEAETSPDLDTSQVKIKKSLTDLKCCVRSCGKTRLEHGARLYPLPVGKTQLKKWIHNLGLDSGGNAADKMTRVCAAHFNRRCFNNVRNLRDWAIPTLHLAMRPSMYSNPKNIPGFFQPTCALAHCRKRRSIDNNLRTYRFPKQEELTEKWRANLRLELSQCRGRICAAHFEPIVRGKLKLKTGAVPTENLGHDEGLVYDNEAIKNMLEGVDDAASMSSDCGGLLAPKTEVEEEDNDTFHDEDDNDERANEDRGRDGDGDGDHEEDFYDPMAFVETFAEQPSDEEDGDDGEHTEEERVLPDEPPLPSSSSMSYVKPVSNVTPICCLRHCRKERTAAFPLSTFGFPKDPNILLKWSSNLQLEPHECVGRVCIEHFEGFVLGTRKLKQNAVPTLKVGHEQPLRYAANGIEVEQPEYHHDDQSQNSVFRLLSLKRSRKRKLTEPPDIPASMTPTNSDDLSPDPLIRCCVLDCANCSTHDNIQMHHLPLDRPQILRKWLHNLQLNPLAAGDQRVCSEHFEPNDCLDDGSLLADAVPTLRLGLIKSNCGQGHRRCLVPTCRCERMNHYSYYELPAKREVREAWLEHLQLPEPRLPAQLCSMHYMQLYEMVPLPETLSSVTREELQQTYDLIANSPLDQKFRCAVPGCQTKCIDDLPLVQLPQREEMCAKWLHNTRIDYVPIRHNSYRVCLLHFNRKCLNGHVVKPGALPTLHLNHNDDIFPYEPDIGTKMKEEKFSKLSAMPLRIKTELLMEEQSSVSPSTTTGSACSPQSFGKSCCISQCQSIPGTKVYAFPTAEVRMLKWVINTQQRITEVTSLYVCREHFEADAMSKRGLRPWALPTLKLGHSGHVWQNVRHNGVFGEEAALLHIRQEHCSVMTCFQRLSDEVRLYPYPANRTSKRKWASNCQHRPMQASSESFRVCQAHFTDNCFDADGELREGAVPTLQLPQMEGRELHESDWNDPASLNTITEATTSKCAVPGCEGPDGTNYRFYNFPKKTLEHQNWCENLLISHINTDYRYSRVCARHFEERCVDKHGELRRGAVPTLHLGGSDERQALHQNPDSFQAPPIDIVCCVTNCNRTKMKDGVIMSFFPRMGQLYKKWLHNLRMDLTKDQMAVARVCCIHFESNCYMRDKIRFGAIPTLHLGHDDVSDIYRTNEVTLGKSRRFHIFGKVNKIKYVPRQPCCYPECQEFIKWVPTYELPPGEALRDAWCDHMGCKFEPELRLCALHFVMLHEYSEANLEQHVKCESYGEARNQARVRRVACSVAKCRTLKARDAIPLHEFPSLKDLCRQWRHNTQLTFFESTRDLVKICQLHFEERCIKDSQTLHSWAIPTLKLPTPRHEETLFENPTEDQILEIEMELQEEKELVGGTVEQNENLEQEVPKNTRRQLSAVKLEQKDDHHESDGNDINFMDQDIDDNTNSTQPLEMEALEVLLEVGHVEKCTSYEYAQDTTVHPMVETLHQVNSSYQISNNGYSARSCCVDGCDVNINDRDAKLHKFPTSMEALRKWTHNTQVDVDIRYPWRYRICSHHFQPDCFNGYRLRHGTMPTLRLGPHRPSDIFENEFGQFITPVITEVKPLVKKEKTELPPPSPVAATAAAIEPSLARKSSLSCQIESCSNHLNTPNIKLHKFPTLKSLCQKWQHNTQLPFNENYRWRHRICSAHFEPFCLVNYRLLHGSVPTLKLGPNAPSKEQLYDNCIERIPTTSSTSTNKIEQQEEQDNELFEPELMLQPTMNVKAAQPLLMPKLETFVYNEIKSGYGKCSLIHCQKQKSQHGVNIFKFPKSKQLQQRWMHNLRIVYDEQRPWKYLICSDHFEPQCIRQQQLSKWAMPTLLLGNNIPEVLYTSDECKELASDSEDDVELQQPPTVSKLDPMPHYKVKVCCLPYCRRPRGDGVKLFRIPVDQQIIRKWEEATGIKFNEAQRNTKLICSRHFDPQLIGVRRLAQGAMPTLNLDGRETQLKSATILPKIKAPTPAKVVTTTTTTTARCCMADCRRGSQSTLHKFPTDAAQLRIWCHHLKLSDLGRYRGKHICSAHLPSKLLNALCRLCGYNEVEPPLHAFPINRNLRAKWCHNLKIDPIAKVDHANHHLCSKHFERTRFDSNGQLLPETTPTLHLKHEDQNIFHNATTTMTVPSTNHNMDMDIDDDDMLLF